VEVELREALAPINRSQGGQLGQPGQLAPVLRTVAQLRDSAAAGVLDLKLSQACYLGGTLSGACLVERVEDSAQIAAIGVENLAQQRGAGRALIEAVCRAATAAGVKQLSILVSDFDSVLLSSLHPIGFARRREVARYTLSGAPAPLLQPHDLGNDAVPDGMSGPYARAVPVAEVLPALRDGVAPEQLLFGQDPRVLLRLAKGNRLSAYIIGQPPTGHFRAGAVFERERKLLHALGGDSAQLPPLLCLLAARHGIVWLDALAEGHPAAGALTAAGFSRTALRIELCKDLG
jgi:hypothetical protein